MEILDKEQFALHLVKTATAAVEMKHRTLQKHIKRVVDHNVFIRIQKQTEEELAKALEPLFEKQIKSMAQRLRKLEGKLFVIEEKGGSGSGNFGHGGRPGHVGGSGEGGPKEDKKIGIKEIQGDDPIVNKSIGIEANRISGFSGISSRMRDASISIKANHGEVAGGLYGRVEGKNYDKEYNDDYDRGGKRPPPLANEGVIKINSSKGVDQGNEVTIGQYQIAQESAQLTFRHEYGHAFQDQGLTYKEYEKWDNIYKEGLNENQGWDKRVSQYGAENKKELFAESFAAYTHPNYKSGQLPLEIENFLKETVGEINVTSESTKQSTDTTNSSTGSQHGVDSQSALLGQNDILEKSGISKTSGDVQERGGGGETPRGDGGGQDNISGDGPGSGSKQEQSYERIIEATIRGGFDGGSCCCQSIHGVGGYGDECKGFRDNENHAGDIGSNRGARQLYPGGTGEDQFDGRGIVSTELVVRGGPGSGRRPYGRKPDEDFDKIAEQDEAMDGKTKAHSVKTGEPVVLHLHRGELSDSSDVHDRIPSQFAEGQYWSPYKSVAMTYGDKVTSSDIQIKNPYVFRLPKKEVYYKELEKEFGTRDTKKITADLLKAGHDALIVTNVSVNRGGVGLSDSAEVILLGNKKSHQPQTKSHDNQAEKLLNKIYNPAEWNDELVNRSLPILAVGMARSVKSLFVLLGVKTNKADKTKQVEKTIYTKTTTATDWINNNALDAMELDDIVRTMNVNGFDILTEMPHGLKVRIASKLKQSFAQDYWDDINETTGGDASVILRQGLKDGWSIRDMAKELEDSLGSGRYARIRAINIARTESCGALNGARKGVMDDLSDDLGDKVPMKQSWMSVLGTTTRRTHADLDGVPENRKGMWFLAGIEVPYPGHPSLPAGERCMCQCTLGLELGMTENDARPLIQDYWDRMSA